MGVNCRGITNGAFYVIGVMQFANRVNINTRTITFALSILAFVAIIFCHFNSNLFVVKPL